MYRQRIYAFLPEALCKPTSKKSSKNKLVTSSSSSSSSTTTIVKSSTGVSQTLRAHSKRDHDRDYPELFKSQASRAISEIPAWMKRQEIHDSYMNLRWNISGHFGCSKKNWKIVNNRIFRNMRRGNVGEPRRKYKSVVKSMQGVYIETTY